MNKAILKIYLPVISILQLDTCLNFAIKHKLPQFICSNDVHFALFLSKQSKEIKQDW